MATILNGFNPQIVWEYFEEICKIPRASKKEEKIIAYLLEFGKKNNLETLKDETGNILIRKQATKGKENFKWVVMQSHVDMVCEKNNDFQHNFDNDPISIYVDNGWIKAKGTTLGADNGIGVAMQLALLASNDIEHGPIECLFTVDEETGLTGAFNLQSEFLKSNILLNLDSEDETQICIGCAGGKRTLIHINFIKEYVPQGFSGFDINVKGLLGGHSGDDIIKGRGNSVKIINRLLYNAAEQYEIRISKIDAGNLHNAIPREAYASIVVPDKFKNNFVEFVSKYNEIIKDELKSTDASVEVLASSSGIPNHVIDLKTQNNLLNSVYACPNGVIAMCADIPGLVETSTNLATIKTLEDKFEIGTSQRSSVESSKEDVGEMVASVFRLINANIEQGEGYPGWKPNVKSEILNITKNCYKKLFDKEPEVIAIHAGLECGVIGEKYPGMDMISVGPTMLGVHSPDEKLNIESVGKFWTLLIEVLKNISINK